MLQFTNPNILPLHRAVRSGIDIMSIGFVNIDYCDVAVV